MKKLPLTFTICILFIGGYAQDSLNIERLSTWTSDSAVEYNDIWGYSANGREYAIMGSDWGTHFIDITDPYAPVEINSFIGKVSTNVIWRDFKTAGNYAYGVCDGPGASSLQIFDLSNLPTSVTKVYDHDSLSSNAHNIFIEGDRIYLPSNRRDANNYVLDILSIADPINPTLIGTMDDSFFDYCWGCLHDIYVKNNIAYCSAGNAGLFIYDLANVNYPISLNSITTYTDQGYNHASWLNPLGDLLVFADETHDTQLKIYSIDQNYVNLNELDVFGTVAGAIPHNPFIVGDEVYISYYHDGMQIFNIGDPQNVTNTAFYDTYPDNAPNDHAGYEGSWGVYPFFESKNIIASDITYGLQVLSKGLDVYTDESNLTLCKGQNESITYSVKGVFLNTNVFKLELSNADGWFSNPTVLDSVTSTAPGTFNFITPNIIGDKYKLRVKSTNPEIIQGTYTLLNISDCIGLDINELNKTNYHSIFPNPSIGKVTIQNDMKLMATIDIINSTGQLIKHITTNESTNLELTPGIYTVKIQSEKGIQVEKLVIE